MGSPKRVAVAIALVCALSFGVTPVAHAGEFDIQMRSIRFFPDVLAVQPGDSVTIRLTNEDTVAHTLDLDEFGIQLGTVDAPIGPGESRTVTFTADQTGVFWFYCAIPGHALSVGEGRWTGMAGRFEVGAVDTSEPSDATPLLIGGVVVLAAAAAVLVYVFRRKR